jgi:hypothetical protein
LYQHALPKRVGVREPRINLTFRWIEPVSTMRGRDRMRAH